MKRFGSKIIKIFLISGCFITFMPTFLTAQQYPTKPINTMVGFAPGGPLDVSIRPLVNNAGKYMGQPFFVSNNPGGGGTVAMGIIAKERPDGYHLIATTLFHFTVIPLLRALPYKFEDFVPIMEYGGPHVGLVVRSDSPWKTLKELLEYAKKNPGKVTYGTPGVGVSMHLAMEYLAKKEGIQWTHIPYPGGAPALTALLGGHITAQSGSTEWIPHVKQGSVRLLATYGDRRMESFPDVPTLKELGYDFVNPNLYLVAAPKGTHPSIVKKLDEALHKAMEEQEFITILKNLEFDINYRNSEDTKRHLEDSRVRLEKMIIEFKIPREGEKK